MFQTRHGLILYRGSFITTKENKNRIMHLIYEYILRSDLTLTADNPGFFIAANEALTNAMEHGNNWSTGKKVSIVLSYNFYFLSLYIEDEGEGFNTDRIYMVKPIYNSGAAGQGIKLIRMFTCAFWNNKGNAVTLISGTGLQSHPPCHEVKPQF